MKNKIIIIALGAFLIDIITQSCGHKQKTCLVKFTHSGIQPFFNYYDSTSHIYIDSTWVIKYDSLQFENSIWGEKFSCAKNTNTSFIISAAYAFKYPEDLTKFKDTISAINFYTIRDYNANYVAGANMDSILIHNLNIYTDWATNQINTIDLPKKLKNTYYSNSIINTNGILFYTKLTQKPTNSGDTVQLAIQYSFTDGRKLMDTTDKIVLTL